MSLGKIPFTDLTEESEMGVSRNDSNPSDESNEQDTKMGQKSATTRRDEGQAGKINNGFNHKKKFLASKATITLNDSDLETSKDHFRSVGFKSLKDKTSAAAKQISERLYNTSTQNWKQ